MGPPFPPVAIVGISGIFPGSENIAGFWRDIVQGRDLITDVPKTHWLAEDYHDPDPSVPDKIYTTKGAFLSPIDIDPVEFGIPPALFPSTDTSQLLALLAARDVLNDATGHDLTRLKRDRVAVILGVTAGQKLYVEMSNRLQRPVWVKGLRDSGIPESEVQAICDRISACYSPWTESTFPGSLGNVVAGRICNRFDLGGANCITDAACASTLAAVSLALSQLYLGQADMVITGGADTFNDPSMYMCFSKTPALSAKGRCRPFDADADGTLLGEGVGFFALKRLADAERDGDHIYAVVKSLEGASDGRALSVYAPLAQGQARAIRRTYASAGFSPSTVELVEAHGTGTRAGDAAEFAGLKMVFEDAGREAPQWCALGSIKSQIGHLKAAAGAASLFKTVMALNEGVLPPTIGIETPNPRLDIPNSPFYLNSEARPWIRGAAHPRRAAVSSFGFGGSNWHMLLEEYRGPGEKAHKMRVSPTELVLLGAETPQALADRCRELAAECTDGKTLRWLARRSQLAWKNTDGPARLSVVAGSEKELAAALLKGAEAILASPHAAFSHPDSVSYSWQADPGKTAFLFPGQGSQYPGMTAHLAMAFEPARAVWDHAADLEFGGESLHNIVFPRPVFSAEDRAAQATRLGATEWTQPAVGAASMACRAVLDMLGLRADMMAGHSFGEISALAAAGAIPEAEALRIARRRGELMAQAAAVPGGMLALSAARRDVERMLSAWELPLLVIANDNGPRQVVISGSVESIDEAQRRATAAGVNAVRLPVAAAFHSPLIAGAVVAFQDVIAPVAFSAPGVPVYANATAKPYAGDGTQVRYQLGEQMSSAVRFAETIEAMYEAGARTFVEVGPGRVLTGLTEQCLAGRPGCTVAMDRKDAHGLTSLWQAIGRLSVAGVPLTFDQLWAGVAVQAPRRKPAMAITITGANCGKPYPPVDGAAGRTPPNAERPAATPVAASAMAAPPPSAVQLSVPNRLRDAPPQNLSADIARSQPSDSLTEAHEIFQRTLSESQTQYLRTMESVFASYCAAQNGSTVHAADSPETGRPAPDLNALATALAAGNTAAKPTAPPRLVSCVPEPPFPEPLAPQLVVTTVRSVPIEATLLEVVSEKTGYPVAMLSLDMALEADLGIDSIKRVEILSALEQRIPDLMEADPAAMAAMKTLGQIVQALGTAAKSKAAKPAASPDAITGLATPAAATVSAEAILLEVVSEKTGYPVAMLSLDMALEADLGIDSIKRVEILSALEQRLPHLMEADPAAMAAMKTLGQIVQALGTAAKPSASVPPAITVTAIPAETILLEVVSEKTGYPVAMLSLDMALEADLGIDSIKRVEILSAFEQRMPDLAKADTAMLAAMKTLGQIVEALGGVTKRTTDGPRVNGISHPHAIALPVLPAVPLLERFRPVEVPARSGDTPFAIPSPVIVTPDGRGISTHLVELLRASGIEAVESRDVPGNVGTVVFLGGLAEFGDVNAALAVNEEAFRVAHAAASALEHGGLFVTVQDTGGDFGLTGRDSLRAWSSGLSALARTASLEWPEATVRAIDLECGGRSSQSMAAALLLELSIASATTDVGLHANGSRTTIETVASPLLPGDSVITADSVLLVSGGARSVTAATILGLARTVRPRLILLGRTPLLDEPAPVRDATTDAEIKQALLTAAQNAGIRMTPQQLGMQAREILAAREVRETLRAIAAAGSPVRYYAVDVLDSVSLASVLEEARTFFGPITGLVHGAGVLADKRIAEKTVSQFRRVFQTKVQGLRSLLEATASDPLDTILLFSSVASRTGNMGQCDYAMANEILNKVSTVESRLRPGCRVRAIAWGPWAGGMVTPALEKHFLDRGVPVIQREEGVRHFVAELSHHAPDESEVVVGGMLGRSVVSGAGAPGAIAVV